jgi:hypothetical protein
VNNGPWINETTNIHIYNDLPDQFIITDPDLQFNKNLPLNFYPEEFVKMYHQDQIEGLIRNVEFWVQDIFKGLLEHQ